MLRWGGIVDGEGQTENKKLRLSLAGLIATSAPDLLKPASDNQNLRMAVADYFREQKDPRAETMLRQLLDEGGADAQKNGGRRAWYYEPTLNRLAEFYRKMEQPQKAQALYEQEERDTAQKDAIASSVAALEVARLSTLIGDEAGAKASYARVARGSYGWAAGLAIWDQANALIEKKQHEAARQLLKQPIVGQGADKARVGLSALLALSYYRTGEIAEARQAALLALEQEKISEARDGRGILEQAQSARELLERLDGWQKTPIQTEPGELRFSLADVAPEVAQTPGANDLRVRRVAVRMLTAEPLQVSSDNPAVQVRLLNGVEKEPFAVKREIEISLSHQQIAQGLSANLTIRSTQNPEKSARLRVVASELPKAGQAAP